MRQLKLYFAPDTCARVAMVALEEAGCHYDVELIAFMQGQHRSANYLALNPKGKVPVLVVDGTPISENVAIVSWLHAAYPEARLLPTNGDLINDAIVLSDLAFCASGLHPIVTRMRIPQFFCDLPGSEKRVFELAEAAMRIQFDMIERRLSNGPWWYGSQWSIVDAYINWVWFRVTGAGFDGSRYPLLSAHHDAIFERPSVRKMLQANADAANSLSSRGLAMQFKGPGAIAAATS